MTFLIPRLIGLGWDTWNVDAQRWMIRSDLFVKHLLNFNFAETYQSYHPGVTLMWLSGFSKLAFYKAFELLAHYTPKLSSGYVYPEQFYVAAFFATMPLVLGITILLTYSCIVLIKLGLPKSLVIIFAIVLSLEPFFLGITRFMHLTGLETALTFSAFVSVLFAIAKGEFKYFFITGLLFGLGFATKSSALVLFPFLVLLVFIYNLREKGFAAAISDAILFSITILLTAGLTFLVIFPAMWVDPINTFTKIFTDGIESKGFVDGPHASILQNKFSYYYEILFIKSLGSTFIFGLISILLIIKEKNSLIKTIHFIFLAYIIYYFGIMSIPSKEMTRYTAVAFPFFVFLSSYSLYKIFEFLKWNKIYVGLVSVMLIAYYALTYFVYYPSFSTYHSDLIGGMPGYAKIRKPYNDGEYYLQVAQYLNSLDDPRSSVLVTKSDNKDASSRFAYLGTSYTNLPSNARYKHLYYAVDFDEIDAIPLGCEEIKQFGPRWPNEFGFIKVFECYE